MEQAYAKPLVRLYALLLILPAILLSVTAITSDDSETALVIMVLGVLFLAMLIIGVALALFLRWAWIMAIGALALLALFLGSFAARNLASLPGTLSALGVGIGGFGIYFLLRDDVKALFTNDLGAVKEHPASLLWVGIMLAVVAIGGIVYSLFTLISEGAFSRLPTGFLIEEVLGGGIYCLLLLIGGALMYFGSRAEKVD